jgi:NAD(P)-dependent dehydrogenase (short-subunit alcohol dehydrogenase family)
MVEQRSGVIVFVTGSPARGHVPGGTAIGAAYGAAETLTENLAIEVGPFGVRVGCVRTLANADSRSTRQTQEFLIGRMNLTEEQAIAQIAESNFLKRLATVSDTARAAVLVASGKARMLTGTVVNATSGAALDYGSVCQTWAAPSPSGSRVAARRRQDQRRPSCLHRSRPTAGSE